MAKYFTQDELQKVSCSPMHINSQSLERLDKAREISGVPFILTSVYRSPEYDRSKGRSGTGAHTQGKAFDILCKDSQTRWKIVFGLIAAGFPRIGIATTFIHADDSRLSPPCIWLY